MLYMNIRMETRVQGKKVQMFDLHTHIDINHKSRHTFAHRFNYLFVVACCLISIDNVIRKLCACDFFLLGKAAAITHKQF